MIDFGMFGSLLRLLYAIIAAGHVIKAAKPFHCSGGSIYFAAHPADVLLYQSPDIFHDLYVFKCTTVVLFTSGERGTLGNHSRLLERGFEEAMSYMAGEPTDESAWNGTDVQFNGQVVLLRSLVDSPHVQILYLRLPNSMPDGQLYTTINKGSLRRLYQKEIQTLISTDGSATYTIDSLKDLISTTLDKRAASEIRILNSKLQVFEDNENDVHDHVYHTISARLVAEVVQRDRIKTNIRSYGCGFTHKLGLTLNDSGTDFDVKGNAYFYYAKYDNHTCQSYSQCLSDAEEGTGKSILGNDDVQYVAKWLQREYYVS